MMKQFQNLPGGDDLGLGGMDFDKMGEGGDFSMDKLAEIEKMLTKTLKSMGIDEGLGDSKPYTIFDLLLTD